MRDWGKIKLFVFLYVIPLVLVLILAILKMNTPNVHTW